jgi:branched-subunit amino acid transport protein
MLAVMAGATYLLRMLPFVLCKRKLTNRYLLSFLEYIPYTVLASMTVPAVFYSTGDTVTAAAGITVAVILALWRRSLLTVAASASAAAFLAALILKLL